MLMMSEAYGVAVLLLMHAFPGGPLGCLLSAINNVLGSLEKGSRKEIITASIWSLVSAKALCNFVKGCLLCLWAKLSSRLKMQ